MLNNDNVKRGGHFERLVQSFFHREQGLVLESTISILVGAGNLKKQHNFDLGSQTPPVLIECKCHTWTQGGNAPATKLGVLNEAMLNFGCAPPEYRKLLVVQRSIRASETPVEHYLKRFAHIIPAGVEVWEFDTALAQGVCVYRGVSGLAMLAPEVDRSQIIADIPSELALVSQQRATNDSAVVPGSMVVV